MASIEDFVNDNRTLWDELVSNIYRNIENSTAISNLLNKIDSSIVINTNTKKPYVDRKRRCCIICVGGSAYESYKKVFKCEGNINFPKTHDYDISLSLFHSGKSNNNDKKFPHNKEKELDADTTEIIGLCPILIDLLTKFKLDISKIKDYDKRDMNADVLSVVKDKFIITKKNTARYVCYRVCILWDNNKERVVSREHIIELTFWKYNYINNYLTISDVKDMRLVKIIDSNGNIHLTVNSSKLSELNIISLKNRLIEGDFYKANKDYHRVLGLSKLVNFKSNDKFIQTVQQFLNGNEICNYIYKLQKYPYVLFNKYNPDNKELYERIIDITQKNHIESKEDLITYFRYTSNINDKKCIAFHFKNYYEKEDGTVDIIENYLNK